MSLTKMSYDVGSYIYDKFDASVIPSKWSDPDNSVKNYDDMLHQSLDKIFREHCLSSSSQVKEFLRSPQLESIIDPILNEESILSRHFSIGEFKKLSLLWISVLAGYEKSAELLVRFGADVTELFGSHQPQVIDRKWTFLHVLVQMRPSSEIKRLIRLIADRSPDWQAQDCRGRTALHCAVRTGQVQMIEILLENGADVNVADNEGMTPLLEAINDKVVELLPLLMKYGADIFAKNKRGQNALHRFSRVKRMEHAIDLARLLIEKGVSLDDRDNWMKYQPIHLAVNSGNNKLVKLFMDHGVNVNEPTWTGESLLHMACEYTGQHIGSLEGSNGSKVIRLLLSAGADVLDEDKSGKTPLAVFTSEAHRQADMDQLGEESWPLIKVLALKKALQPSIELKDEKIINQYTTLRIYYLQCSEEIESMKYAKFIESFTFFDLFKKSQCHIATLMRNPEFELKFWLYNLNDNFSIYVGHILQAFERAQKCYHAMLEQTNVIDEAVYNILPYLVVQKVVHYMFD